MHFATSRVGRYRAAFALLSLMLFAGLLHANNSYLSVTPATVQLSCNAATGLSASVPVTVSYNTSGAALSSTNSLVVAVVSVAVTLDGGSPTTYTGTTGGTALANSPVQVSAPASQTLTSNTGTLTYTVSLKSSVWTGTACSGLSTTHSTTSASVTFSSKLGTGAVANDNATVTANVTQTAPLSVSPSTVNVYCEYNGTSRSAVSYSTPVSISDRVSASVTLGAAATTAASWLSLGSLSSTTVTSSSSVTLQANAQSCPSTMNPGQTATGSMTIPMGSNSPYADITVPAVLTMVYTSPLTATPRSISMTYAKGGPPATGSISLVSGGGHSSYFSVDTSTLPSPSYFTVDAFSGTAPATGGKTVTFNSTGLADNQPPGIYSKDVHFKVAGSADYVVTVSLTINNPAPVLSVAEGKSRAYTWIIGNPIPTPVVTLMSSGTPIAYTIPSTAGVVSGVAAGQASGLAYSMGTAVGVVFDATQFQAAQPGQTLTGSLTITGGGTTIVVTFNILVNPASAVPTITGITPSSLPTAASGQTFVVTLYGTGFNAGPDPTLKTVVGVVSNVQTLAMATDSYIAVNIVNNSTIVLTITASASDTALALTSGSGAKTIGVCNPGGQPTCTTAQSTATLNVGSVPSISAVTSASSFSSTAFAKYDIISVFGSNFCNSGGTGCGANVLYGMPDPVTLIYPTVLSPDGHARDVSVKFYSTYTNGATALASAPLLFATNSQINAIVPSAVGTSGTVDVVVWFGTSHSSAYTINLASSDPGIFTIGSDGTGEAAVLASDYSLINSVHPAIVRPTGSDSIQVYMTGLGAPLSSDTSTTCIGTTNYLTNLQAVSNVVTTLDGAIMQSTMFPGYTTAPCLAAVSGSMSFGEVSATPSWLGWVTGTVAGLYQVNVQLPNNAGSLTPVTGSAGNVVAPTQIAVQYGASAPFSQSGVTMWVEPRLGWSTAPSTCNGSEAAGSTAFTCTPVPSGGSGYTYTATTLPSFLSRSTNAFTSSDPAGSEGTSYMVTLTAKDGTNPNTLYAVGSFVLDIPKSPAELALTGTEPTVSTYGVENNITTVSTTGGTGTITYTVTTPNDGSITVDASGVVATTSTATPGARHIVVNATDSSGTPKTGNLDLYATILLQMASSNGASLKGSANVANTNLTRITTLGSTGAVTYTKLAGPAWVSIGSSTGIVALSGSSQSVGTYSVTIKASDAGTSATGIINLSIKII